MRCEIVRSISLDLLVIYFSYSCCALRGVGVLADALLVGLCAHTGVL